MKGRIFYREGDWIAVPLDGGSFAHGVIARCYVRRGILLGYFFPPALSAPAALHDLSKLSPSQAVLIAMFGDYGLVNEGWPVIGQLKDWDRRTWPVPPLAHVDAVDPKKVYIRRYDERTLTLVDERLGTLADARHLHDDALFGSDAIKVKLASLLRPSGR